MKLIALLLLASVAHAADLTFVAPFPSATSNPAVIVDAAGTTFNTGYLALCVGPPNQPCVWYRGHTQYTVIGIPSAYHKIFQSSQTVLQSETGGHLTVLVEVLAQAHGSGRYISWTYQVISGEIIL